MFNLSCVTDILRQSLNSLPVHIQVGVMGANPIAMLAMDLGLGGVLLSYLHPNHLLCQHHSPFVVVHHVPLMFGMQMPVMMPWVVVLLVELVLII